MVDPRLVTLLTLCKVKNYTKTAQRLFITQPAVTHHIKTLEKEFEIQIFSNNKTFELTPEGNIMVEYAIRMIDQSTQLQNALEKSRSDNKPLSLAMTNAASIILKKKKLLNIFYDYYNNNALIRVEVLNEIIKELQEGKIDLAIIDGDYDDDLFDGVIIDTVSIVPVCYKEGKFKEIRRITREMLKNNPINIGGTDDGMGAATLQALKSANVRLTKSRLLSSNSTFVLSESIEATDGIGFMYLDLLDIYSNLKKMDLLNFNGTQNIYLIYNNTSFDKPLFKKIITNIKKNKGGIL